MRKLIDKKVSVTLFHMALPMLAGTVAMNAYNLVDTWYVAKLGTLPLAAMGFTFPIVMLITFLVNSIGTGITTLTSHAIGRSDRDSAVRNVTQGIVLTALISVILSITGYLTIKPVFTLLGADSQTMPYIQSYMRMWYLGAVTMAFPMTGNGILISLGDSKNASRFMVLGSLLNCALDPVMIFGLLGFPAMGIFGAALATVIAQGVSAVWLFFLLIKKHHIINFKDFQIHTFFNTVKRIMNFAIPGSISMILTPLSGAIITALISRYGNEAVAAAGAAGRIEMFAFVVPMALGISLIPFTSQNFGAERIDRIEEAKKYSSRFAFIYGLCVAVVFFLCAPFLAGIFTEEAKVTEIFILYVRIISFGYGMMEIHRYCGFLFTGIHKPVYSTVLNAVRVLVFFIPLSYLGSQLLGIKGIFFGRLITDLTAGTIGYIWVSRVLKSDS